MFESTIYVFAYSFVFDFVSCTILLPGDIMLFFPYLWEGINVRTILLLYASSKTSRGVSVGPTFV